MKPNHEVIGMIFTLSSEKYKTQWKRILASEYETNMMEKCARKTAIYFMYWYLSPDMTKEVMQCTNADIRLASAFYEINKDQLTGISDRIDNYLKN